MKKLIWCFVLVILIGCNTIKNTPVIIYNVPKIQDVTGDVSEFEYNIIFSDYILDLKYYIKELINQIKNKVNYIDLRIKEKEKEGGK